MKLFKSFVLAGDSFYFRSHPNLKFKCTVEFERNNGMETMGKESLLWRGDKYECVLNKLYIKQRFVIHLHIYTMSAVTSFKWWGFEKCEGRSSTVMFLDFFLILRNIAYTQMWMQNMALWYWHLPNLSPVTCSEASSWLACLSNCDVSPTPPRFRSINSLEPRITCKENEP